MILLRVGKSSYTILPAKDWQPDIRVLSHFLLSCGTRRYLLSFSQVVQVLPLKPLWNKHETRRRYSSCLSCLHDLGCLSCGSHPPFPAQCLWDCPAHDWRPAGNSAHQLSPRQLQAYCQQHGSPLCPDPTPDLILPKNIFRGSCRHHQLRRPLGLAFGPLSQSYRGEHAYLWASCLSDQLWLTEKRTNPGYRLYRCRTGLWAWNARRHASFSWVYFVGGASVRGCGWGLCGVFVQEEAT